MAKNPELERHLAKHGANPSRSCRYCQLVRSGGATAPSDREFEIRTSTHRPYLEERREVGAGDPVELLHRWACDRCPTRGMWIRDRLTAQRGYVAHLRNRHGSKLGITGGAA